MPNLSKVEYVNQLNAVCHRRTRPVLYPADMDAQLLSDFNPSVVVNPYQVPWRLTQDASE